MSPTSPDEVKSAAAPKAAADSISPTTRDAATPRISLGRTTSVRGLIAKVIFLGLVGGLAVLAVPLMIAAEQWVMLAFTAVIVALIFFVYTTQRYQPAKYILPGSVLLAVFVITPIIFNVQISGTNFGDGTRSTKSETIDSVLAQSVQPTPGTPSYNLAVGTTGSLTEGPFTYLLLEPTTGNTFIGTKDGLTPTTPGQVTLTGKRITAAQGFTVLTPQQVNAAGAKASALSVPTGDGEARIYLKGTNRGFVGAPTITYDAATDTLTDTITGVKYTPKLQGDRSFFTSADGKKISDQSWQENVGALNYQRIMTDDSLRGAFISAFLWTLAFGVLSVGTSFILGLFLAVTLNDERLRARKIMRAFMIVPYALPGFITLSVWASFYNRDFGLINDLLGLDVNWLGDPFTAKVAILLTNLWAGFPYMFLICTGALQGLPKDVEEAASIDGASPIKMFLHIKFPLLLVSVAPLLVASFAFNFNNFNAIQLLTGGGPFESGALVGQTDILISAVYRLAFGGSGAQFGLAAAGSVLLFILTAVLATIQFRSTKALEDVS